MSRLLIQFIILPDCDITSIQVELFITLTDSGNDGWNGLIFGLKQGSKIVYYFGNNFTSGGYSLAQSLNISGNRLTKIAAETRANKTE